MKKQTQFLNRILACGVAFSLGMGMLTGCSNAIPNMNEEEQQKVGEYAAIVLLKYDAKHRSRLVDLSEYDFSSEEENVVEEPEEVEEQPEEIEEPVNEPEIPVVDVTEPIPEEPAFADPALFLEFADGMTLNYKGYSWSDSYTNGSTSAVVEPTAGSKLLVVRYNIYNGSGIDQNIDLFSTGYSFKVSANGGEELPALPAYMLLDDMSSFIGTVKNGFSTDLVLLFEVDNSIDNNLDSLDISIRKGNDICTVALEG